MNSNQTAAVTFHTPAYFHTKGRKFHIHFVSRLLYSSSCIHRRSPKSSSPHSRGRVYHFVSRTSWRLRAIRILSNAVSHRDTFCHARRYFEQLRDQLYSFAVATRWMLESSLAIFFIIMSFTCPVHRHWQYRDTRLRRVDICMQYKIFLDAVSLFLCFVQTLFTPTHRAKEPQKRTSNGSVYIIYYFRFPRKIIIR